MRDCDILLLDEPTNHLDPWGEPPQKGEKMHGERKICLQYLWSDAKLKLKLNQSISPPALSLSLLSLSLSFSINASYIWSPLGFQQFVSRYSNLRGLPEFLGLAVGSCLCPVPWQDKESVEWLSEYLRSMTRTTLMVISHDPTFLNKVCTDIIQPLALNYLIISSLGCKWSETQGSYKAFCLLPCPTLTAGTRNPELPLEGRPRHMAWCF